MLSYLVSTTLYLFNLALQTLTLELMPAEGHESELAKLDIMRTRAVPRVTCSLMKGHRRRYW